MACSGVSQQLHLCTKLQFASCLARVRRKQKITELTNRMIYKTLMMVKLTNQR